jgi:hypothetical protein
MTIDAFLEHWHLVEHPFRGEEARQDALFTRMVEASVRAAAENPLRPSRLPRHPDYDKIAGEFSRPSTAIVFGEKGSGKTAIRLQMATSAAAFNALNPSRRVLLVSHDELAGPLQHLHERLRQVKRGKESPPLESLRQMRLADHVDALLCAVVPRVVDAALEHTPPPGTQADRQLDRVDLGPEPRKALRKLDRALKRDLLVLQVAYDRPDQGGERSKELRKALGLRTPVSVTVESVLAFGGWVVPLSVFLILWGGGAGFNDPVAATAFFVAMGLWLAALLKRAGTERLGVLARARRLRRQIRVSPRPEASYARSVRQLPPGWRPSTLLPSAESEEVRLAQVSRLIRVLRAFSYESMVVVIDRVDEPPIIQGDPERMKAVVWPLLSNRFLQMEGVAFKLLLPIELRYQLMRESSAFFQDARLDKQSMIEQLAWTGVALYDLANQRLSACQALDATPLRLADLFAPDVTASHLCDALEQMRQPRDAFKLLYQCVQDHCTQTPPDEAPSTDEAKSEASAFRIARSTLDHARKSQVERLRQLALGIRPA